jgi:glutathione S-transferase
MPARTLYHFKHSPFSRRTRLALAHKRLDVELRDARENPAFLEEARRLAPFRTMPVLVDDGRAMGDSVAIVHFIDRAYPGEPRVFPEAEDFVDALQTLALVDVALDNIVNVGMRYYPLRDSPAWDGVKEELLGRARRALDGLAALVASVSRPTVCKGGWSVADMWIWSMVSWLEGMPARAQGNQNVTQILSLGVAVPPALSKWAAQHDDRADVRALQ